ncbi:MAG: hypothetical protein ACE5H0_00560 [Bacteroidota bacterium]
MRQQLKLGWGELYSRPSKLVLESEFTVDAVSSGIYLYRISARALSGDRDEYFELRKMVLTR